MSKQHGKLGAVYAPAGLIRATTISFTASGGYINDSGNGFITSGFQPGQVIVVTGSASNNATFTIATGGVAAGKLTVTGTPTGVQNELAGATVLIVVKAPGTVIAGCSNWTLDKTIDLGETTDFQDGGTAIGATSHKGIKTRIAGLFDWTATAEGFWDDATTKWRGGTAQGGIVMVRLFEKYVASPSAPDPAYYWEGLAYCEKSNTKVDVQDVNKQTLNFTGIGVITYTTKTASW